MNGISTKHTLNGHSIWLVPGEADLEVLERRMRDLAHRFSAPEFPPHITLWGQLEHPPEQLRSSCSELAARPTISLKPTGVDGDNSLYRSLFLALPHAKELIALRATLRQTLELGYQPYFPHLSLLYAELSATQRQVLIHDLNLLQWPLLTIRALQLVHTAGSVKDWQMLDKFTLSGSE